jgi:diguanylate cyclase (GGDEF)-like protein
MLAIASLAGCGHAPDLSRTVLTSAGQVRQLSASQVRLGVRVRIRGILTYFDGISSYCFVQDSTGGIRVSLAPGQAPPAVGWRVDVAGLASSGGAAPAVVEARLSALGPDALPPAIAVSPARLADPVYEYKRVAIQGVVQSVTSERPGLVTLEIRADQTTFWAKVPASVVVVNEDWTDAEVRASGVLGESLAEFKDGKQAGASSTVWISDPGAIETTRLGRATRGMPISTIRSLLALDPARLPPHRVRIRGVPAAAPQGGLAVMDDGGQILVRIGQFTPDPNARTLDVAGFVAWEKGHLTLERAVLVDDVEVADRDQLPASGAMLTTALEVHQLPLSAAQRAYPVHLRGVVTYFDPGNHLLFVQDSSDGIFVELSEKEKGAMQAGDQVEVTGVTTADFAPDVAKARIRVLSHPGLPAPKIASLGVANWGREDCHWIELDGIVQHVAQGRADALLTLAWGRNTYKAHVLAPTQSLAHLVDAEVKLRGVCGALFNGKRQMLGIQMFVPGAECIRVVRAPSPDPFSMSPTPIADLLQFSGAREMGHWVRLRGTVTYPHLSGPTWLRDSTGGVMIQDHEIAGLAAGDLVDVVGFPEIAGFGPILRGSRLKRVQSGPPPLPVRVTARDAMRGDFDGQLVQIEGKLIDRLQQPAEQVLAVSSGEVVFTAHLPSSGAEQPLEPGTRLRLTGICSVEVEQSYDLILPRTFRLLLRSPADVVVVGRPPWLNAGRLIPILAGAALLIVAALSWAGLLRKRVRTQTLALRAQTMQLQAAHQRTRDALRKACEAESMDLDSNRILELIARDEPVDLIVDHIAEAVALHCEGATCVIMLGAPHGPRVCVVPAMPAGWLQTLKRIDVRSVSLRSEFRAPRQFSDDPAWAEFIDGQLNARFRTFCVAPIVVDSAAAGVIAAFFRSEKPFADVQGAQLGLWCNIAALALERRRLHDQLSYRAQHDGLTGLPNRVLLYERLENEIARALRGGGLLGVLYIDLDGFKQINDTYGHDAGDAVLREAAERMSQCVRRGDTVARIGGDEFVVLLPLLGRREDAEQIADKIAAALGEPIYSDHQRLSVSACTGIAVWPLDGDKPDPLLRFADAQMYGEKRRRWYDAPAKSLPDRSGNAPAETAARER